MKLFPITVKKIIQVVGGSAQANAQWTSTTTLADPILGVLSVGQDLVGMGDPVLNALMMDPEVAQAVDAALVPAVSATIPETEQVASGSAVTFTWSPTVAAIGSGGTVPWQDTFVDGSSTSTTHGGDGNLILNQNTLSQQKLPLFQFDLTRFAGFTANGNSTFTFRYDNAQSLNSAITNAPVTYATSATAIFNETTVSFSNRPTISTALTTVTFPAGGTGPMSITIPAATVNLWLGKWVAIQFAPPGATTAQMFIFSKESVGNEPTLTLNLAR